MSLLVKAQEIKVNDLFKDPESNQVFVMRAYDDDEMKCLAEKPDGGYWECDKNYLVFSESKEPSLSGVEMIAAERKRQVDDEDWSEEHDTEQHGEGDLALAAACYASPVKLLRLAPRQPVNSMELIEPWPWEDKWDKRYSYGECRDNPGNQLPNPSTMTKAERMDLLVKAGALIAAEIDRIKRSIQ